MRQLEEMDRAFLDLVHSYLPTWQVEQGRDQPEAAVLYAAWRLLEDTRKRMDRLPDKHERQFLSVWGLESQEAHPMSAYAALTAPEGELLPAGSPVYLSGDGTRLWNTLGPVYAQSLTLAAQVMQSGRAGKLLELPPPTQEAPTPLFDFRADGQQRQAARFAQPDLFRSQNGCTVRLEFPKAAECLLDFLTDSGKVRWGLEGTDGSTQELPPPQQKDAELVFNLPAASQGVALTVEVVPGVVPPPEPVGTVFGTCQRADVPYASAVSDEGITVQGAFRPFGMAPEPWRSCCLSCPDVLTLRGGTVKLACTLSTEQREELLPGGEDQPEYKPIMRRLPTRPTPPRDVYPQQVVWEYWNGWAWMPVPGWEEYGKVFWGDDTRTLEARFSWPQDAQPCQVGGQKDCWLHWRVTQADGTAFLPRRLHVPVVRGLTFSGVLSQVQVEVTGCSGLSNKFAPVDKNAPLFPSLGPLEDGWWLCFDQAPERDSLSLYVDLSGRGSGTTLTAWEDAPDGPRPLELEDGTAGLCYSGILALSGIQGQETQRFGRRGWWLCLRDQAGRLSGAGRFPQLAGLYAGAVGIQAQGGDRCQAGESVLPVAGGPVSGVTMTRSFGGASAESDQEVLTRARQHWHHLGRGVSPLDIEQLVRESFRDVARTWTRRTGGQVKITVLLRDVEHHSAAFAQRRASIIRLLEEKSHISTLGLDIQVVEPRFYPIQIMVWLRPEADGHVQSSSDRLKQTLARFLHPVNGHFRGAGWQLGDLPTEWELERYVKATLPERKVVKLLLTAVTPEGWEVDCGQVGDPLSLPVFGGFQGFDVGGGNRP